MAQQQQQEDKLGTSVTYTDPNKTGQPITMQEITFFPNEAVDLADTLPEDRAKQFAKKLAGNPSFKVEGGPDHQKLAEERQKQAQEVEKKKAETAERQQREASRASQQPPPDWKGPDQPTLESESKRGGREEQTTRRR